MDSTEANSTGSALSQAWSNFSAAIASAPPSVFDSMSLIVGGAWLEHLREAEEALHEAQVNYRFASASSPEAVEANKEWLKKARTFGTLEYDDDTRMGSTIINENDWGIVRSALFLASGGEAGVATIRLQHRVLRDDRERTRATRWLKVSQYANAVSLCEKMCEVT